MYRLNQLLIWLDGVFSTVRNKYLWLLISQVVKGSGVGSEKFSMVRNPDGTGGLKVIQPLDYEETRVPFRFKVQVKDTVSITRIIC